MTEQTRTRCLAVLALLSVTAIVVLAFHGPIPQDPAYHAFADQRAILGIPNFWNVTSNLPFALVAVPGILLLLRGCTPGVLGELRSAYIVFLVGALLVAPGSAYYHLNPTNSSLVWDRLPMTISFMAFFAIIIGEHMNPAAARRALPHFCAAGMVSVLYWAASEHAGRSDLRLYAVVQFLPMLLIPAILLLFPSRLTGIWLVWGIIASYVLAKIFEFFDGQLYGLTGVSGHTVKHVFAAAGVLFFVLCAKYRRVFGAVPNAESVYSK